MRAIDSDILSIFIKPDARIPDDPATGKPVEHARERVQALIDQLEAERVKILIPTPALGEILVIAGEAGPEYLADLNSSAVFKIADFDQRAAVEAAAMLIRAKAEGDKKGGSTSDWQRIKVDRQIVATAKANSADTIYSNDPDIAKYAADVGIKAVALWELPMPPPTQMELQENPE